MYNTEATEGTEVTKESIRKESRLTERIIGLGIKVHRRLGPGLLEGIYTECLCWELRNSNLPYAREVPLALVYEDLRLAPAYRADIIVAGEVIVEI